MRYVDEFRDLNRDRIAFPRLALQRIKRQLEPDIGLERRIVQIARNPRTFLVRSSARHDSVRARSANLVDAYALPPGPARSPEVEPTLMMLPYCRSAKCRADSRATRVAPRMFTSQTRRMSSAVVSSSGAQVPMPALFTSTL